MSHDPDCPDCEWVEVRRYTDQTATKIPSWPCDRHISDKDRIARDFWTDLIADKPESNQP